MPNQEPGLEDFAQHELTMAEAHKLIKVLAAVADLREEQATPEEMLQPVSDMVRTLNKNMILLRIAAKEYLEKKNA